MLMDTCGQLLDLCIWKNSHWHPASETVLVADNAKNYTHRTFLTSKNPDRSVFALITSSGDATATTTPLFFTASMASANSLTSFRLDTCEENSQRGAYITQNQKLKHIKGFGFEWSR